MESSIHSRSAFWGFLAGVGAADPSLIEEFSHDLEKGWMPLGQVLTQQGSLTASQLAELMRVQEKQPDARIGDLAVQEGFCFPEDIEAAVAIQRESYPHPIELILDEREFDEGKVFAAMVAYIRHLEGLVHNLRYPPVLDDFGASQEP